MSIRVGHILRHEDESGVSGVGRVAEWIEYSDGEVVVHWLSHTPSTNHYRNMKQVEGIHGHWGKTEMVVDWEEPRPELPDPEEDGLGGELEIGEDDDSDTFLEDTPVKEGKSSSKKRPKVRKPSTKEKDKK